MLEKKNVSNETENQKGYFQLYKKMFFFLTVSIE